KVLGQGGEVWEVGDRPVNRAGPERTAVGQPVRLASSADPEKGPGGADRGLPSGAGPFSVSAAGPWIYCTSFGKMARAPLNVHQIGPFQTPRFGVHWPAEPRRTHPRLPRSTSTPGGR